MNNVCRECGNLLNGVDTACPECGTVVVSAPVAVTPSAPGDPQPLVEESHSKGFPWLLVVGAVWLLGVAGAVGYFQFYLPEQNKPVISVAEQRLKDKDFWRHWILVYTEDDGVKVYINKTDIKRTKNDVSFWQIYYHSDKSQNWSYNKYDYQRNVFWFNMQYFSFTPTDKGLQRSADGAAIEKWTKFQKGSKADKIRALLMTPKIYQVKNSRYKVFLEQEFEFLCDHPNAKKI